MNASGGIGAGALLRQRRPPERAGPDPDAGVRASDARFDAARRSATSGSHPEAFQSENFRTNLSAAFTPKFDVNVNAGFLEHQSAPAAGRQQHVQLHLQRAEQPGLQPRRPWATTKLGIAGRVPERLRRLQPRADLPGARTERDAALHRLGRRERGGRSTGCRTRARPGVDLAEQRATSTSAGSASARTPGTQRQGTVTPSQNELPQLLGEARQQLDLAGAPEPELQDDARRRLHEPRERRRQQQRHATCRRARRTSARPRRRTAAHDQLQTVEQDARPVSRRNRRRSATACS